MPLYFRILLPVIVCIGATRAHAQTVVTKCQTFSPGNYILAGDLTCSGVQISGAVQLDCAGHTIHLIPAVFPDGSTDSSSVMVVGPATLTNCTVDGGGEAGVGPFTYFSLEASGVNPQVSKCSLENVWLNSVQGALFANNTLKGGFELGASSGVTLRGNTIHGLGFVGAGGVGADGTGIEVYGGGSNNTFTGNLLDGGTLGGSGVFIYQGAAVGYLIQGNTIQNYWLDGIEVDALTGSTIDGNTISNTEYGIMSGNPQWSGNAVTNTSVQNAEMLFYIRTQGAAYPGSFSGNRFIDNVLIGALPQPNAPAACADFTASACDPFTVLTPVPGVGDNLIQGNDFSLTASPPVFLPVGAFTDGGGNICSANTPVLTCLPPASPLIVTTTTLPHGTAGSPYLQILSATGGSPPLGNWVLNTGMLPPGLTLNAYSGTIGGVPTTAAGSPFHFSVIVKDATGAASAPQSLSVAVSPAPALTLVTPSLLLPGTVSVSYAQAFSATGGATPYQTWSITAGTIPPGTSFSSNPPSGLLSGTPTAAGTYAFAVQVTDSVNATATGQFSLTINPVGTVSISASGIVNAASYAGGGVAPGEIVTVFGSGIGPDTLAVGQPNDSGILPSLLAGVQVLIGGTAAPVVYAESTQVTVVVPYEVSGETATSVQLIYQGQRSLPAIMPVTTSAPAVFSLDSSGSGAGAILNQDWTVNSVSNPAAPGSVIVLYATGGGKTSPPSVDGQLGASPLPGLVQPVTATVGGMEAQVLYAGSYVGGVAGALQVNLLVPPGVTPGNTVPVTLNIGGASSQTGLTVSVQ